MTGRALAEALPLLEWLPALENVNLGSDTLGPEALCSLVSAYPGTEFEYRFRLLGRNTSLDDSTLDLSAAGSRDMKELLAWLPAMTRLERVNLGLEADRRSPGPGRISPPFRPPSPTQSLRMTSHSMGKTFP